MTYLCTRPNDDLLPGIFVSTQLKGARLVHQVRSNLLLGVPVQFAIVRGLAISVVVVVLSAIYLKNRWVVSGIPSVVALFAQLWGALLWRFERWFKNKVAG